MEKATHEKLSTGRWHTFSLSMQMGNIGSEVNRFLSFRGRDEKRAAGALDRALRLIDLTIADPRWKGRTGEFFHLRDVVVDLSKQTSVLDVSPEAMRDYFLPFSKLAITTFAGQF